MPSILIFTVQCLACSKKFVDVGLGIGTHGRRKGGAQECIRAPCSPHAPGAAALSVSLTVAFARRGNICVCILLLCDVTICGQMRAANSAQWRTVGDQS